MRPYVALDSSDLVSPEVRLYNYVKESSIVAIEDIIQLARDIHYKIPNTLDFLMSCNGYILKNREYLIEEAILNINVSDVKDMERLIEEELEENNFCAAIRDLSCVAQFPRINVPWDEWLIYSVLRKYGSKLDLYTTAYQFRLSIPVISVKYHYVDEFDLQNISKKHAGTISNIMETKVDDLDNLDELIEEFIDIDDIDFDFDDFDFEEDV